MPLTEEEKKDYFRRYYKANKKRLRQENKEWVKENKEKKSGYNKKYQESNKEKVIASRKKWWEANKDKKNAEQRAKYAEKNAGKKEAKAKKRRDAMVDLGSCPINDQCERWYDGCDCEQSCGIQAN